MLDTTIRNQTQINPPTNNWRSRRTKHSFYAEFEWTSERKKRRTTQKTKNMSDSDRTKKLVVILL